MAENSSISWTRHTFNAWIGCTKVSAACKFCYAERDWDHRFHRAEWGPHGKRILTSDENWKKPLRWNKAAAAAGERHRVFCNSLSDVFDDHPSILPEWRSRLWTLISQTQSLEWLLLTKRPQNWPLLLPAAEPRPPFENMRLGVSIEDHGAAADRLGPLSFAHAIGWPTFVSYEPACGPVDWDEVLPATDWLISGGESGPKARPSQTDWFRDARDACTRHCVPYHHKQNGEWLNGERIGLDRSGRLLDGVLHDAFPVST